MSKFFTYSTVDELIDLAKKPVDYTSFNDIQSLHYMRDKASSILFENEKISDSVRRSLESIVSIINDKMDTVRSFNKGVETKPQEE